MKNTASYHALQNAFSKFISDNDLVRDREPVLLAVSGGIDSMAMANLFLSEGIRHAIAHCNFRLRGAEADADEDLVRSYALSKNIPFHTVGFDTQKYAYEWGISIQMAARELRYSWFRKLMTENGYAATAVAHNLDDQVETILLNLARGTGLTGLSGMRIDSGDIIRPLLFASRKQIVDFSRYACIPFREDKSNSDTKYSRNKLRHKVIPVFREINPSFDATISKNAGRFAQLDLLLTEYVDTVRKNISRRKDANTIFDIEKLASLAGNRSLLFELFSPFGTGSDQISDLVSVINGRTGSYIETGHSRIIRNRNELLVTPLEEDGMSVYTVSNADEFSSVPFLELSALTASASDFMIPRDKSFACLDAGLMKYPVVIRRWKEGDSFVPFGMKRRKKLSDFFTDRKYSIDEKTKAWIAESDGKIFWIVGERIDDRFRVTEKTKSILLLRSLV